MLLQKKRHYNTSIFKPAITVVLSYLVLHCSNCKKGLMSKIRPNDPCSCGSGQKYKKCCGVAAAKGLLGRFTSAVKGVKTPAEIEGMRKACRFNAQLMNYIRPLVKIGMSTGDIDRLVHEYTIGHGHIPAPLNYHGFPKSVCTSRNSVVCHGIPSDKEFILDGDIINVDLTTIVDGFFGDQSETFLMGNVSKEAIKITEVSKRCLEIGIDNIRPGISLNEAAGAMQDYAESQGCSVVRDFTGHGIGRKFHEDPQVTHYRSPSTRKWMLAAGQTFTIEPMINIGHYAIKVLEDGWTAVTKDGSLSAQFEHTLLVTETGVEVLTDTTKV
jgi:methionyl aminopeptidase